MTEEERKNTFPESMERMVMLCLPIKKQVIITFQSMKM